ncbi:MAG TPA: SGNH hydrolase domain-containing protein [Solirubrobacteraceae bacterium]|nr:SGNH hydrolase domain-containing protein [Solirubrobacteraceae bacterium]
MSTGIGSRRGQRPVWERPEATSWRSATKAVAAPEAPAKRAPAPKAERPAPPGLGPVKVKTAPAPKEKGGKGFRLDIQGLRAIAIILVVLYHAHIPGVTGGYIGVDIFFVISGFLITGQLLGEVDRRGTLSIAAFYARRVKRLLPLSTLVLVSTVIAAWALLVPLQATTVLHDALYTAGYGMNYHLAVEGTNYLQAASAVSPLQHYWSLAVEEQFYFVWPFLLLIISVVAARRRHLLLTGLLLVVVGVSLFLCVTMTKTALPWAYFSLPTRAWELAIGALIAVNLARLSRLPSGAAAAMTWAGIAAMLGAAFVYTDATVFPGIAAAVPVLGCAAVIAGGCARPAFGAERILRNGVAQGIGRLSYGWYLWHWPILIIAEAKVGHSLSTTTNLALIAAALIISRVTYSLVEEPVRKIRALSERPWRGIALGLALSGVSVAVALAAIATLPSSIGHGRAVVVHAVQAAGAEQTVERVVAASVNIGAVPRNLTPALGKATTDLPVSQTDGCWVGVLATAPSPHPCFYGDVHAKTTIVLYGDSHADQWLPAFIALGRQHHWRVMDLTKASCPPGFNGIYDPSLKRTYTECDAWHQAALSRIAALHPNLVVMSEAVSTGGLRGADSVWAHAASTAVGGLHRQGIPTLFLGDTPRTKIDGPACVAANLGNAAQCELNQSYAYYYPARRAAVMAAARGAGAHTFDVNPLFCSSSKCMAVIGSYLVYRDSSHVTATYARWLAPALLAPVRQALGSRP